MKSTVPILFVLLLGFSSAASGQDTQTDADPSQNDDGQTQNDAPSDGTEDEGAKDNNAEESAAELYQRAQEHFKRREWTLAAQAFERALQSDPDPILAYNTGRSYEYSGKLDQAERFYIDALRLDPEPELRDLLSKSISRVANIKRELGAKNPTNIGLLDITTTPVGAIIAVNGKVIGSSPYQASHPSGEITIEITADGYTTYNRQFNLEPGQEVVIATDLERRGRLWTWITLGTGVALVGGGVWTGIIAQDRLDTVNSVEGQRRDDYDALKEEGQNFATASIALYSLGAVALLAAGGLYIYETPQAMEEDPEKTARIQWLIAPDFIGLGGRF